MFLFRFLVSVSVEEGLLLLLELGEQGAKFADLGSGTPIEGVPGTAVLPGVGAWASGVFPRFPLADHLRLSVTACFVPAHDSFGTGSLAGVFGNAQIELLEESGVRMAS